MYLEKMHIKYFRGISELNMVFNEGLNIIIGENNTCKTALLDALRLCLNFGSQQRDIFIHSDDFYSDQIIGRASVIEFDLIFNNLNLEEQGVFIEMLSENEGGYFLELHIRYILETKEGTEKIKFRCWGGKYEGQSIPFDVLQLLNCVYLGALRDAEKDLAPRKGGRIGQLFTKVVSNEEKQKEYADRLNDTFHKDDEWRGLIRNAKGLINEHLKPELMGSYSQRIGIKFLPQEFKKIVEGLKIYLPGDTVSRNKVLCKFGDDNSWKQFFVNPEEQILTFKREFPIIIEKDTSLNADLKEYLIGLYEAVLFEIEQNGLGYNNLIYIATILGDLIKRKSSDVESYYALLIEEPEAHLHPQLQDVLFSYFKDLQLKGKIQVIISSHSPTITAKTHIDSLTVLFKEKNSMNSIDIKKCPLEEKDKKYLERFMDITKCQLFFSKGVIFVEGISEAILFPIFAEKIGMNLDRLGVEVINVGGVSFAPFMKLFNSNDSKYRLNIKAAVISDDDNGSTPERIQNLKQLEGGALKVYLASHTFEAELFNTGNKKLLFEMYKKMHPRFDSNFARGGALEDFLAKLLSNKDKAELAQLLAFELNNNEALMSNFVVPQYICHALEWVNNP